MEIRSKIWILKLPVLLLIVVFQEVKAQQLSDLVDPFIGTSNYGATYPGPIAPRGMASISPFNVAGPQNPLEKDSQWLSNPYVHENTFLTGFSHANLSGVGCPDLGVLLLMPTTGEVETDHLKYGTTYSEEEATAGYYQCMLDKYNIRTELTASTRVGVSRHHFPAGKANILLNLGLGLTNEQGAMVKIVSDTEIEGMRSVGSFCYNSPEDAYPVYFVARFDRAADEFGTWKKPTWYKGVEAQWMGYNGRTRLMDNNTKMVAGDSIGTYFSYNFDRPTAVEVKIGISYVSIENARENLEMETGTYDFDVVRRRTRTAWNNLLSRIQVEGGSLEDRINFYTALYHILIHPNTLNDVNGDYPEISTGRVGNTDGTRYTVFSLWDTYRNVHQLLSLVYPEQQSGMIKSMLQMNRENGWLPKWELNSTETFTMVGDPAGIVIADSFLRGIRDFNIHETYAAMKKSADQREGNPLRPGLAEYIDQGYLDTSRGGSVSTTEEYNLADFALAALAKSLGHNEDEKRYRERSLSYRKLFDPDLKLLRPRNPDGSWYQPFDPFAGANFTKNVGFIEGNAWQYAFMVPHDIRGLMKLMGGRAPFTNQLQKVFDTGQFDMANEPDIAYPFLFNYVRGEEWRSQRTVSSLMDTYFQNKPAGLPGNDDTGTMSAWLVFSMMGIYPAAPAVPNYAVVIPRFDTVRIRLHPEYYGRRELVIRRQGPQEGQISKIMLNGKALKSFFVDHRDLVNSNSFEIHVE
jgi:predicted alpha-1,2-mannosidase